MRQLDLNLLWTGDRSQALMRSVNRTKFREHGFLRELLSSTSSAHNTDTIRIPAKLHALGTDKRNALSYTLLKNWKKYMRPLIDTLSDGLSRYANVYTRDILAQVGVSIPADSAQLSPADQIFTHFPFEENRTLEMGRLGEESQRIHDIFSAATRHSLILLVDYEQIIDLINTKKI